MRRRKGRHYYRCRWERGVGVWCTVHNLTFRRVGEDCPDEGVQCLYISEKFSLEIFFSRNLRTSQLGN